MHYVALRCYLRNLTRITVTKRDRTTRYNKQQEENKGENDLVASSLSTRLLSSFNPSFVVKHYSQLKKNKKGRSAFYASMLFVVWSSFSSGALDFAASVLR